MNDVLAAQISLPMPKREKLSSQLMNALLRVGRGFPEVAHFGTRHRSKFAISLRRSKFARDEFTQLRGHPEDRRLSIQRLREILTTLHVIGLVRLVDRTGP
jgi:hypothetical protein